MSIVLGISAFYHDSAAALLVDGEIVAAVQEERFTRKKHDAGYPRHAIDFVLGEAKCSLNDVDAVVFYDKPFLKFERLLETYIAFFPRGLSSYLKAMPIWLKEKLFQKDMLLNELKQHDGGFLDTEKLLFTEHHVSHAASAFFPSPFEEALVLTMDGVGEWATCSVAIGRGERLDVIKELHFPHSLGLLYSAFTYYLGFKVNSGEYKIMGLAPYGEPKYSSLILDHLLDLKEDGSFRLDMSYFSFATGLTMTNKKFSKLFGEPLRSAEGEALTQFHMDMAASVQNVTETIMLKMTRALASQYGLQNLCLAGGVALNCVANGKLQKDGAFKNIWVQPAAGDAGGALGAAYAGVHMHLALPRKVHTPDAMKGSYLGPEFSQGDIENRLLDLGAVFEVLDDDQMFKVIAKAISEGSAVGWYQGRMEFGPRALGGRSILGDPRSESMQKTLNLKVKFRESFRPFAPSVLEEQVSQWFDFDEKSPYMLMVASIKENRQRKVTSSEEQLFGIEKLNVSRSEIPAITHVDYSARIQTVSADTNERYFKLLEAFYALTQCPVLINTSFNVRGEPIVNTPDDAFKCFMGTGIEILVCGNAVLYKEKQDQTLAEDYTSKYELD